MMKLGNDKKIIVFHLHKKMKRGAFILLEGVDRSGKTTQCKRLIDALTQEGIKAKFYNFPSF